MNTNAINREWRGYQTELSYKDRVSCLIYASVLTKKDFRGCVI